MNCNNTIYDVMLLLCKKVHCTEVIHSSFTRKHIVRKLCILRLRKSTLNGSYAFFDYEKAICMEVIHSSFTKKQIVELCSFHCTEVMHSSFTKKQTINSQIEFVSLSITAC